MPWIIVNYHSLVVYNFRYNNLNEYLVNLNNTRCFFGTRRTFPVVPKIPRLIKLPFSNVLEHRLSLYLHSLVVLNFPYHTLNEYLVNLYNIRCCLELGEPFQPFPFPVEPTHLSAANQPANGQLNSPAE